MSVAARRAGARRLPGHLMRSGEGAERADRGCDTRTCRGLSSTWAEVAPASGCGRRSSVCDSPEPAQHPLAGGRRARTGRLPPVSTPAKRRSKHADVSRTAASVALSTSRTRPSARFPDGTTTTAAIAFIARPTLERESRDDFSANPPAAAGRAFSYEPFALAADLTRTMAFYRRRVPVERQSSSSQPVTDGSAGPTGTIARARRRGRVFGSSGCSERHDRPCVAGVLRARELVPVPRWRLGLRRLLVVVRVGCLPIALWWPPFLFRCGSVAEPSWLSLRNGTGTVVAGR